MEPGAGGGPHGALGEAAPARLSPAVAATQAELGRLALGCVDLMKHAGKRIIGGQPAPKACPEPTHERKALSAFQDLDPYRTS